LKKIDYLVPNNPDIPNLIVQIEALTQENGMSLDAVDFRILETKTTGKAEELRSGETGTAEKPVQNYHLLDINIRISGDYPAFKNFLKEIENNIRLFDLQSVGFISATSKEGETGKFEFDINLQAYYKP
jgi:Tfp pilus assembly protein PilO